MSTHKSKRKLRPAHTSPVDEDVADAQRRLTRRKGDSDDMDYQPSEKSADEPGSTGQHSGDEDEKHREFAVPVPKYKGLELRPMGQSSDAPSGIVANFCAYTFQIPSSRVLIFVDKHT